MLSFVIAIPPGFSTCCFKGGCCCCSILLTFWGGGDFISFCCCCLGMSLGEDGDLDLEYRLLLELRCRRRLLLLWRPPSLEADRERRRLLRWRLLWRRRWRRPWRWLLRLDDPWCSESDDLSVWRHDVTFARLTFKDYRVMPYSCAIWQTIVQYKVLQLWWTWDVQIVAKNKCPLSFKLPKYMVVDGSQGILKWESHFSFLCGSIELQHLPISLANCIDVMGKNAMPEKNKYC